MSRASIIPSVLAVALAGVACADAGLPEPVYIPDFAARSPALSCAPLPTLTAQGLVVEDLVPVGAGSTLVLAGRSREAILLDSTLVTRWRLALKEEGPGAVASPVSADLLQDGTLLVADRGRQLLQRLDPRGEDRGTLRTPFFPSVVRRAGSETFVVPAVLAGYPERLLYRIEDGAAKPEPLPLRRYPGMTHGAFANRLGAVRGRGSRLVLMHAFYVPEAYVRDKGIFTRHAVPVPEPLRPLFRSPRPVEREEDLSHLPVVAVSPFFDPASGDVIYLTRTGEVESDGTYRKALIRVDSTFGYRSSGILPVDALLAAPAGRDSVLVVSNEGVWHRCEAP